ncbi:hypothetical protein B1694_14170 [Geobacillus zalihae]|nr:hypothetical protein B1694_14170 [Geobacillus zalihae]
MILSPFVFFHSPPFVKILPTPHFFAALLLLGHRMRVLAGPLKTIKRCSRPRFPANEKTAPHNMAEAVLAAGTNEPRPAIQLG